MMYDQLLRATTNRDVITIIIIALSELGRKNESCNATSRDQRERGGGGGGQQRERERGV